MSRANAVEPKRYQIWEHIPIILSMLKFVFGFRYVAPFWNEGNSKATEMENRGYVRLSTTVFHACKIMEAWAKCLSRFFCAKPRIKPIIYFCGAVRWSEVRQK